MNRETRYREYVRRRVTIPANIFDSVQRFAAQNYFSVQELVTEAVRFYLKVKDRSVNSALLEALSFYANQDNWRESNDPFCAMSNVQRDSGRIARQALGWRDRE